MVSRRFLAKPLFAEPLVSGAFISITCFSLAWERRSVLFYWLFCISGRFVRLLFCNRIQPGCFAVLQEIALCRKKSHFVARNRNSNELRELLFSSCNSCDSSRAPACRYCFGFCFASFENCCFPRVPAPVRVLSGTRPRNRDVRIDTLIRSF